MLNRLSSSRGSPWCFYFFERIRFQDFFYFFVEKTLLLMKNQHFIIIANCKNHPKTQRAQIPLTNLDQHDGTTGPSLKPDWSFSASPVTFTIFFFFFFIERGNFGWRGGWVEGRPVTAGEWRSRAVATSPWVFPAWRGRAS